MKKLKTILYCSFIFPILLGADSLEKLLKENINTHPKIKSSLANYQSKLYELDKAKAGYSPTLDFSAEYGKEKSKIASSFKGSRELNAKSSRLLGKYNLFDGFKTKHEIAEKESAVAVAKNKLFQTVNKLSLLIIQVYLEVLRRKELLEIEHQNVRNHLDSLEKVKRRLKEGEGYESDLRQTKARVKLAQTNYLIREREYKNAEINYQIVIRKKPITSSMYTPVTTLLFSEKQIESLILEAQKKSYLAQIQNHKIEISKSIYQQQGAKDYPTINLEVSQTWSDNLNGFKGKDESSKVALVLNYNFYNGGANKASQLSALQTSEMNIYELDDIKLDIEGKIRVALMKYEMLERQEKLLDEQLEFLQGTRELYEIEYQHNKRTVIDLLNIKQEYNYARSQKTNVHYDKIVAYFQFKNSMGNLIDEFHLNDILDRR
jgi:adhesin transport system outer membrane protein